MRTLVLGVVARAMLAERQVTLQARLVDARTGEQFGTLTIPFEVY
jgi:hypothetical protein